MSTDSGTGGTGDSGAQVQYDYNSNNNNNNNSTSEKNNYSVRPPSFNGDATQFSWWKSKMYSHII